MLMWQGAGVDRLHVERNRLMDVRYLDIDKNHFKK